MLYFLEVLFVFDELPQVYHGNSIKYNVLCFIKLFPIQFRCNI